MIRGGAILVRLSGKPSVCLSGPQEQCAARSDCGRVRTHADHDDDDGYHKHPGCCGSPGDGRRRLHDSPLAEPTNSLDRSAC